MRKTGLLDSPTDRSWESNTEQQKFVQWGQIGPPQEKNRTILKLDQGYEVGNAGWYVNLEMSTLGNFWNTLIFGRLVQFAKHWHNDQLPQRVTWAGDTVEISVALLKHGTRCWLSLCPFLNSRELVLYVRCESAGWPSELVSQHATTPTVPPLKTWSLTLIIPTETLR